MEASIRLVLSWPRRLVRGLRSLHRSETATLTVEWIMVITVALVVLTAIYYVAQWVMTETSDSVKEIEGKE